MARLHFQEVTSFCQLYNNKIPSHFGAIFYFVIFCCDSIINNRGGWWALTITIGGQGSDGLRGTLSVFDELCFEHF